MPAVLHNAQVTSPPTPSSPTRRLRRLPTWLHASDLQGLAQLATQGVLGATRLAEQVQGNVYKTVAAPFGPLGKPFVDPAPGASGVRRIGITGLVYGSVRGVTRLAGGAVNAVLAGTVPLMRPRPSLPPREAMLAILNGVLGDQLVETGNPLAITMSLRYQGESLALDPLSLEKVFPGSGGKLLVMLHGLCMNDLQWSSANEVGGHGALLAHTLGYVPIDLHYNTGLNIADNGGQLSNLLDRLVAAWPSEVESITLLAHSMGGLVARSACHEAETTPGAAAGWRGWRRKLKAIVFLGTPHHGAPLEQLGNWVDRILGSNTLTRPFAAIGQIRSRGITDLRWGTVRAPAEAGSGADRFAGSPDARQPLALPADVDCYAVAGKLPRKPAGSPVNPIGDGLVTVTSALGQHEREAHHLAFAADRQWVADGVNHLALIGHADVGAQMLRWLRPDAPGRPG